MDGCKYESNCPLMGPGTIGGLPSVGVFLRGQRNTVCRQLDEIGGFLKMHFVVKSYNAMSLRVHI